MIFFPLSFVSISVVIGAVLYLCLNAENQILIDFIDTRPLKAFALWLLGVNAIGLVALFTLSITVPRPKVIWFNLIYVWVTCLVGVLALGPAVFYFSDGQHTLQIGQSQDVVGVAVIFVIASLFSTWRIEILDRT